MLLLYVLVAALMLALGAWQLARAAEKIRWQASADAAMAEPALALESAILPDEADGQSGVRYRQVSLRGQFMPQRQMLWDNRVYRGVVGYEVITPLRLENASVVLVNRGWVRADPRREILPEILWPPETGPYAVSGILTRPSIGFSRGPALEIVGDDWPQRLQHFTYAEIAAALGAEVLPGLVQRIHFAADSPQVPLYTDAWTPVAFGPQRHYGYAFQWFAMFVALTVLFVVVNTSRFGVDP